MTFNFELKTVPNKKGKYPIYLRITENRRMHRIKTTIELSRTSDWNKDKQRIRTSEPNAASWNEQLDIELERAKSQYRALKGEGVATSRQLIRSIKGETDAPTLLVYARRVQDSLKESGQFANYKKYCDSINKLEAFLTDSYGSVEDVIFAEVNACFVEKYFAFLSNLPNSRAKKEDEHLHPNSIAKHMKVLRAIINRAINQDHYMKPVDNPFTNFSIKEIPTVKDKLQDDEIEKLRSVELPTGSLMNDARNAYLLSMYCAGMRLGDVIQLRWQNVENGRLLYPMRKNDKYVDIKLVPQAVAILNEYYQMDSKPSDYIFPFLDNNAAYAKYVTLDERKKMPNPIAQQLFTAINTKEASINRELKVAAIKAGLKQFNFHSSRHTFARQAHKSGVSNLEIQRLMAHSSLNVTERYMKSFDTEMEDEALDKMFTQSSKEEKAKELLDSIKKMGFTPEQIIEFLK